MHPQADEEGRLYVEGPSGRLYVHGPNKYGRYYLKRSPEGALQALPQGVAVYRKGTTYYCKGKPKEESAPPTPTASPSA